MYRLNTEKARKLALYHIALSEPFSFRFFVVFVEEVAIRRSLLQKRHRFAIRRSIGQNIRGRDSEIAPTVLEKGRIRVWYSALVRKPHLPGLEIIRITERRSKSSFRLCPIMRKLTVCATKRVNVFDEFMG